MMFGFLAVARHVDVHFHHIQREGRHLYSGWCNDATGHREAFYVMAQSWKQQDVVGVQKHVVDYQILLFEVSGFAFMS